MALRVIRMVAHSEALQCDRKGVGVMDFDPVITKENLSLCHPFIDKKCCRISCALPEVFLARSWYIQVPLVLVVATDG